MRDENDIVRNIPDGYTTTDVVMRWKNGDDSIHDVDDIEIPQFTITNYFTYSTEVVLATGNKKSRPDTV